MRIISTITLTQIMIWGIFLLGDYLSEAFSNDVLLWIALFMVPLIIPVLYLIFQKRIYYDSIPKWVNTLTVLFMWVTENVVFERIVSALQMVPQAHNGWENMFNGIEYIFFPFFNIAGFLIIVVFWNLLLFLYKKLLQ